MLLEDDLATNFLGPGLCSVLQLAKSGEKTSLSKFRNSVCRVRASGLLRGFGRDLTSRLRPPN